MSDFSDDFVAIHHGDCLDVMASMPAESVHSIVTDPPYGLSFMGREWDYGIPGEPFWREALRVAKPGAHLLAFGGTRTYHRLACAIEDAGWEVRDCIMWVYSSGFPKSMNLDRLDAFCACESNGCTQAQNASGAQARGVWPICRGCGKPRIPKGLGTSLKPAYEPIIVARKPLSGTVAATVCEHGTGALNIDGCRVGTGGHLKWEQPRDMGYHGGTDSGNATATEASLGRWPANLIHDGSDEVVGLFPQTSSGKAAKGGHKRTAENMEKGSDVYGGGKGISGTSSTDDAGTLYGDSGSAARFFYTAKATKAERDEGLEGFEERKAAPYNERPSGQLNAHLHGADPRPRRNFHPTVKPLALMRYLCRLVTPPDGIVLDPFMGSGTTLKAARAEGFRSIGIDLEREHCEIAWGRMSQGVLL